MNRRHFVSNTYTEVQSSFVLQANVNTMKVRIEVKIHLLAVEMYLLTEIVHFWRKDNNFFKLFKN